VTATLGEILYGLREPLVAASMSFDHSACELSTFCRNPLHPGPCKGWKKTLGHIAPGALNAIEKAHKEKTAARRAARAAAKAHAEKIVATGPANHLEHPLTAKKKTLTHAHVLMGDTADKANAKSSKAILNKTEIKKYSQLKGAQVASVAVSHGYVEPDKEKDYAARAEKMISEALAKDNVDGGEAHYRKAIEGLAGEQAAGFADKHCGIGTKDGDCDGLLWESLRTRAEYVLERALLTGNQDGLRELDAKVEKLGDDRKGLAAYLKSVGVDPAMVKKQMDAEPPAPNAPEEPKLSGFEKGEKTKMDNLAKVAEAQTTGAAGAATIEKVALMVTGKKLNEQGSAKLAGAMADLHAKGEGLPEGQLKQIDNGVNVIASKVKAYTGVEMTDEQKAKLHAEILSGAEKGTPTPMLDGIHKSWSSKGDKAAEVTAALNGEAVPLNKWQQKAIDALAQDPSDHVKILEILEVLDADEYAALPDEEKAKLHDWLQAEVEKGTPKAAITAHHLGALTGDEINAAGAVYKQKQSTAVADAIHNGSNGDIIKAMNDHPEQWAQLSPALQSVAAQKLHSEKIMGSTPAAQLIAKHNIPEPKTASVANVEKVLSGDGYTPWQKYQALNDLSYAEYQGLDPDVKKKADTFLNEQVAIGNEKIAKLAKDFDVPPVTPSTAMPPATKSVLQDAIDKGQVSALTQEAVEAGLIADKIKSATAKKKLVVYGDLADKGGFENMSPTLQAKVLNDLDAMHAKFKDPKKKAETSSIISKLQAAQGGGAGAGGAGTGTSPVGLPNTTPPVPAPPVSNAEKATAGAKFLSDAYEVVGQPPIGESGQEASAKVLESLHNNGPGGEDGFTAMSESLAQNLIAKSALPLPETETAKFIDPLAADIKEKLKATGAPTPVYNAWQEAAKANGTPAGYSALVKLDQQAEKWHNDNGEPDALQALMDAVPMAMTDEQAAQKYTDAFVGLKQHATGEKVTQIGKTQTKKLFLGEITAEGQQKFVTPGGGDQGGMSQGFADGLASLHTSKIEKKLGVEDSTIFKDWQNSAASAAFNEAMSKDYHSALVKGQDKPDGVAGSIDAIVDEVNAQAKKTAADNGWSQDSVALETWKAQTFIAKAEELVKGKQAGAGGAASNPSPISAVHVPKDLPEVPEGEEPALGGGRGIGHLSEATKSAMGKSFKGLPVGSSSSDPSESVFDALMATAAWYGAKPEAGGPLSVLQMAQVIDEWKAQHYGSANKNLTEKKLVSWLGTKQGKEYAEKFTTPDAELLDHLENPGKAKQPKVIYVAPGLKVQDVGGPGAYDPSLKTADFTPQKNAQAKAARDAYIAASGEKLTATQKAAIKAYTGSSYHEINGYLRGTSASADPTTKNWAVLAQAAMRPLQENTLLHRGSSFKVFPEGFRSIEGVQKLIGQEIQDDGLVSSSVGGEQIPPAFRKQVRLQIEAPIGTMGLYVDDISANKGENELILAAGTKYRILGVDNPDSSWPTIRLRVIS
jgi:hypothetical protein